MAEGSAFRYARNDEGEKIVPSSVRPDGSIRPERRVREGYIPQEEQPIYKSEGALVRRGLQVCPGSDFVDEDKKKTGLSKSAKKREKKKQKAKEENSAIDGVTEQIAEVIVSELPANEKQIRTLRKKLKQCDALLQRQEKGEKLTEEELEKLAKRQGWLEDLESLEKTS